MQEWYTMNSKMTRVPITRLELSRPTYTLHRSPPRERPWQGRVRLLGLVATGFFAYYALFHAEFPVNSEVEGNIHSDLKRYLRGKERR